MTATAGVDGRVVRHGVDDTSRARLLAELADVEACVAVRAAQLADELERVAAFRLHWYSALGPLLVELAAAGAERAAHHAREATEDPTAAEEAEAARAAADAVRREWEALEVGNEVVPPPDVELKRLYRLAARRFHPDVSPDSADQDRCTALMAEANAAYAARDTDRLRRLLDGAGNGPDPSASAAGGPASGSLAALVNALTSAWRRLDTIDAALAALAASDDGQLMRREEALAVVGRSLIDETRAVVEAELGRTGVTR